MITDADATNDQTMNVVSNGTIENNAWNANGGNQSVFVNGAGAYDTWTRLGLDFDSATRTFDASIDGANVATGVAFNPTATGGVLGYSTFGQDAPTGTTENAHFDNYAITLAGMAVPEANSGSLVTIGTLVGLGGFALARRRRVA